MLILDFLKNEWKLHKLLMKQLGCSHPHRTHVHLSAGLLDPYELRRAEEVTLFLERQGYDECLRWWTCTNCGKRDLGKSAEFDEVSPLLQEAAKKIIEEALQKARSEWLTKDQAPGETVEARTSPQLLLPPLKPLPTL